MSFLNQLKSQASALQSQQTVDAHKLLTNSAQTEEACQTLWNYVQELAKQLNVLMPPAPALSLDGKTPWPAMKLANFRFDARKKVLRDKEVYDYVAMGWDIVPQQGVPLQQSVSVNFPPDLERVEKRLACGQVEHERQNQRHPEKGSLQAIRFVYTTRARGSLQVRADHDKGQLDFRLANVAGFEVLSTNWPAARIQSPLLDEMAKLILAQPNRFI